MNGQDQNLTLVDRATAGDKAALEQLLASVQDLVFNLSLRMLGTLPDAQDASQEILLKVMTHLSSYRRESAFTTWVFRIAVNHLKDYRKSMFAEHPLSFEVYGSDIANGRAQDVPDMTQGVDRALLERELKLSCTNVMLQCLDAESRLIFILGTMFRLDSRIAGEVLEMSPEAYRQRLSRTRKKMSEFLAAYCGLSGTGMCACGRRVNYAIASHRIRPDAPDFTRLAERDLRTESFIGAMEALDDASSVFDSLPYYRTAQGTRQWIEALLQSDRFETILQA